MTPLGKPVVPIMNVMNEKLKITRVGEGGRTRRVRKSNNVILRVNNNIESTFGGSHENTSIEHSHASSCRIVERAGE